MRTFHVASVTPSPGLHYLRLWRGSRAIPHAAVSRRHTNTFTSRDCFTTIAELLLGIHWELTNFMENTDPLKYDSAMIRAGVLVKISDYQLAGTALMYLFLHIDLSNFSVYASIVERTDTAI